MRSNAMPTEGFLELGKSCTKLNCMKTKIFEKATSTLVFYKKQSLIFSKRLMSDMEAGKGKPSRYSCKI